MGLVDSEHVLIAAKDDAALAGAVRRLVGEPAFAARLAAAGRAFVVARHDWRRGAETLDAALTELAARR